MIRLYGHMAGSFRTVTRGLELAFQKLGVLEGVFIGETTDFEEEVAGGAQAPISVTCGDPLRIVQAHHHGKHKKHFLLLAPNSNSIPSSFVRQLKDVVKLPTGEKVPMLSGLLAPSKWAVEVLQREFPEHPVIYCPHGVLPEYRMERFPIGDSEEAHTTTRRAMVREMPFNGVFKLLHITSSRLSRKGTRELIEAWKEFCDVSGIKTPSTLDILVNPMFAPEFSEYVSQSGASQVQVIPGESFSIHDLIAGMQNYHFVVQPSRAEGFGLVPLEALACGVPVIATAVTGHLDFLPRPGAVIVKHGEDASSDDSLGATAPTVSKDHILEGLFTAFEQVPLHHDQAVQLADSVAEEWAWERKVAPAVEQMKELI